MSSPGFNGNTLSIWYIANTSNFTALPVKAWLSVHFSCSWGGRKTRGSAEAGKSQSNACPMAWALQPVFTLEQLTCPPPSLPEFGQRHPWRSLQPVNSRECVHCVLTIVRFPMHSGTTDSLGSGPQGTVLPGSCTWYWISVIKYLTFITRRRRILCVWEIRKWQRVVNEKTLSGEEGMSF